MNCCVKYINTILLVFLIVAGQVQPNPQTGVAVCRDQTSDLFVNSFPINTQTGDLAEWTEQMRSVPDNVCTKRSGVKTTCVIDYTNTTQSSDWCLQVPDTIYIETTLIYRCTNTFDKQQMYYSVKHRPACYASSCYDGYDQSILETIERATFDSLVQEFATPNTDSEWWDQDGYNDCVQMRFEITEPIVSEAVAGNLVGASNASPTSSPAPTLRPTATFAPTKSPAPTYTPVAHTCESESLQLVSDGGLAEMRTASIDTPNRGAVGVAEGLSNIKDILVIDTDTGMGFDKHCTTIGIGEAESYTALCEFDYEDVIEFVEDTGNSIAELCQTANGIYVEDSLNITCASEADSSDITRLVIKNKPSCRSKLCNADGVREVATTEFDRWMKLTLEKGLDEAFAQDVGDATILILNGTHSCVIESDEEDEEESIVVAVGGSSLANIGGVPIPPTDQCRMFTENVNGNLEIYNQKAMFQREILDYVDVDMRQICGSTRPGRLECDFDWTEVLVSSESSANTDTLKSVCMPDGTGSTGAGQYVESVFEVTCVDPQGDRLIMNNRNVPGCIGRPCTPGQSEYLLVDDYNFLADKFIAEGWTCTTEVISVFAPHYNPFVETYSMNEVGSNPQFSTIVVDETNDNDAPPPPKAFESSNQYLQTDIKEAPPSNRPTLAPTGDAFHRGQNYGALLRTQSPTAAFVESPTVSSSSTNFPYTVTLLLMLPTALSMLNL